jgi:hypothetical protein
LGVAHNATEHFARPVINVIVVRRRGPFAAAAFVGFNQKELMVVVVGFKIRNFFFKSAYLLHQSVLGLLGREDFVPNICDRTAAAASSISLISCAKSNAALFRETMPANASPAIIFSKL